MPPKRHPLTPKDCRALLREFGATPDILEHCQAVAEVAVGLASALSAHGIDIDVDLVQQGALLHDLDKILTLRAGEPHGVVGARILRERGYPEMASIVQRHLFRPGQTDFSGWSWEERLVHYADKLCIGPRVVSLPERLDDLRARYPGRSETLERLRPIEEALERAIRTAMKGEG